METVNDDFTPLLEALCAGATAEDASVRAPTIVTGESTPWWGLDFDDTPLPSQGWKLHVAAHTTTALTVIERVVPLLVRQRVSFKVAPTQAALYALNQGKGGLSQIGKFMTVYPTSDAQAVALAQQLDNATWGIAGPLVPTDRVLHAESSVSYRYGSFQAQYRQSAVGKILPMLRLPDGSLTEDKRPLHYVAPPGIPDPFEAAGIVAPLPFEHPVYGGRYLHVKTLVRAVRNQVHLAVDLDTGARVVVKTSSVCAPEHGGEPRAADLLRQESNALQSLSLYSGYPRWYAFLELPADVVLIMEVIDGVSLEQRVATYRSEHRSPTTADMVRWGLALTALVQPLHEAGWVHRDLKTSNILVTEDDTWRLIDFDIAARIDTTPLAARYGTVGYMSPQQGDGGAASVQDDIYSMGALLYGLATLTEPSHAPQPQTLLTRPLSLLNPTLHPAVCTIIERCLDPIPDTRYTTVAAVTAALRAVPAPAQVSSPPSAEASAGISAADLALFEECATRLVDTLLAQGVPTLEGQVPFDAPDLFNGAAGRLRMHLWLWQATGVEEHLDYAIAAAQFLTQTVQSDTTAEAFWLQPEGMESLSGRAFLGYSHGTAGIADALLDLYAVTGDEALRRVVEHSAASLIRAGSSVLHGTGLAWPEAVGEADAKRKSGFWCHGGAGIGLFPLRVGKILEHSEALTAAAAAGRAVALTTRWANPVQCHGLAGNIDVLLSLYQATGDAVWREAAATLGRLMASFVQGRDGRWVAPGGIAHGGEP